MTYIPRTEELERQRKLYAAVRARLYGNQVPVIRIPPKPVKRDWLHLDKGPKIWPPGMPEDAEIKLVDLLAVVSRVYGVSRMEIISARRGDAIMDARRVYYWCARAFTSYSYPQIGRSCGMRDHTSVMNGVRRVEGRLNHFADKIAAVKSELGIAG